MNFENVEIDEINKAKKALADFYNGIEEMNKSLRMDTYKLSLLNIDLSISKDSKLFLFM